MSSITGYKSYNNVNLQGVNTTTNDITNIENDITVIENKLSLIKSVKDYGALGDGVTDDTTAIQTALNTYGKIWFPDGVYMVTGLIVYPNTHIYGDGRNKTICKLLPGGANLFNCHLDNISIRSMSIDGSRDTGGVGHCLRGNVATEHDLSLEFNLVETSLNTQPIVKSLFYLAEALSLFVYLEYDKIYTIKNGEIIMDY